MKRVIFLVGESGSGKTTLIKRCLQAAPNLFSYIKSIVTRKPRPGEVDGVDYDFVSGEEAFWQNDFVQTIHFGDQWYGTALKEYQVKPSIGLVAVTHEGIWDIINGLAKKNMKMDYRIMFWLTPDKILAQRGVDLERIKRGNIRGKFLKCYMDNSFKNIPIKVVVDDKNLNKNYLQHHNNILLQQITNDYLGI